MATKRVTRIDRSWTPLALPTKTPQGFLIVEGYATRSGVFEYRNADGTVRREWRPADQVLDATSLDSLRLAPMTLMHPADPVTIDNVADLRVGTVGDGVSWDSPDETEPDARVRVRMIIDKADAIKAVEEKTATQLSCGYSADVEDVKGVTPNGEAYDSIQRNIRYNHLALVDVGRAGHDIGIRVDRADVTTNNTETDKMKKLILDGVPYEAPEQTIAAVDAHNAKAASALAAATAALGEANAKASAAEARADAATAAEKAAQKAASDLAAKVKTMVADRRALERKVADTLGAEAFGALNLDEMDDKALRVAVIKHVHADAAIDDAKLADDAYVAAYFDIAVSKPRNDAADVKAGAGTARRDSVTAASATKKSDAARAAYIAKRTFQAT